MSSYIDDNTRQLSVDKGGGGGMRVHDANTAAT